MRFYFQCRLRQPPEISPTFTRQQQVETQNFGRTRKRFVNDSRQQPSKFSNLGSVENDRSRCIAVFHTVQTSHPCAEFGAVVPADLWAFDTMRRGPLSDTLPTTPARSGLRGVALALRPIPDIGLEHFVLEVLAVHHGLGDVVEADNTHQHVVVHHRHVARVVAQHHAPDFI